MLKGDSDRHGTSSGTIVQIIVSKRERERVIKFLLRSRKEERETEDIVGKKSAVKGGQRCETETQS